MRTSPRSRWLFAAFLAAFAVAAVAWYFDPRYFTAAELDAKPFPLRRVDLDLPSSPAGAAYYGRLKLNIFIGRSGEVDRVEVATAAVPTALRDLAVQTFSRVRWEPGRKLGRSVKSVKVIEVDFTPPIREVGRAPMQPDQ
jgi:hypothetical protein